jgi:iron(II)-dependent oxidoreductase
MSGAAMKNTSSLLFLAGAVALVATGCLAIVASWLWAIVPLLLLAPAVAWYVATSRATAAPEPQRNRRRPAPPSKSVPEPTPSVRTAPVTPKRVYDENDPASLAQRMLDQGRYALLLRPQIAANLRGDQRQAALLALDEGMGIIPEGDVLLQPWRQSNERDDAESARERLVHVDAMYLDRFPVTNRQFQEFVDDGGYQNMPLWDATIWPAVLDFVDRTGHPGPRFWSDGHFPPGQDDHPVVGVSWYEGAAFARWCGKRLPSDPEWVKAGCWPVLTQGTRPMQRRFPWGDTMDRELVNLWGSGPNATVSVYDLPDGVSVGGIYHLIGNVWEWTTSNFGAWDTSARRLETSSPLKSIRGGAFDTYFETQATCQFQSGESPINRKHNIGFRCALALCDAISTDLSELHVAGAEALAGCGATAQEEFV